MLRVLLNDIKKVTEPDRIFLAEKKAAGVKNRNWKHLVDLPDLKNKLQVRDQSQYADGKLIDGIRSLKDPEKFIFVVKNSRGHNWTFRVLNAGRLALFGFLFLLLINFANVWSNGLNVKDRLIASASDAYENFLQAAELAKNQDFTKSNDQFSQASQNLNSSLEEITFLTASLQNYGGREKNILSLQNLLEAGNELAQAGILFSGVAENFKALPQKFISFQQQQNSDSLTDQLRHDLESVDQSITHLKNASEKLNLVTSNLIPQQYQEKIDLLKSALSSLLEQIDQIKTLQPAFLKILGDRYPHRFLVLLQNDSEARATGGFIGSYLIIDLNEGHISKMEFHDVYDLDGQITEAIPAPEEIARITDNWGLRDSNYSPNFDLSAEKAAWFLQNSHGPSVDSIIAINQSFLKELLQLTGPLQVDGLQSELNSENYQLILSYLIESKFYGAQNPKKILGKTIDSLKKNLSELKDYQSVLKMLLKAIQDKKIMLYSRDPEVQELFDYFNLTPRLVNSKQNQDYLHISTISIGGNKSDQFILQRVNHDTIIRNNGELIDELTITRTHTFSETILNAWKKNLAHFGIDDPADWVFDILGRGVNKAYLKVYVPLGSELENVIGFDQNEIMIRSDSELSYTYFLIPFATYPGQPQTIILRYKLPYKLNLFAGDIYRFWADPQPGVITTTLNKTFNLGSGLTVNKAYSTVDDQFSSENPVLGVPLLKQIYLSLVIS